MSVVLQAFPISIVGLKDTGNDTKSVMSNNHGKMTFKVVV
jgi:hypothetical protein